jgi:hypothetical protein
MTDTTPGAQFYCTWAALCLLNDGVDEVAPEDRIVKDPCSNNGRDSVELITPDDSASISRTDCLAVGEILLRVRRNWLN